MAGLRGLVQGHWQLLLLTALIIALWPTRAVVPLKILVVFLHEASHAAAVLLTGGSVETLAIDPWQGGAVSARGGNRFVSLSAGYLGSLLIGVSLFVAAVRTRYDRPLLGALGGLMLAVSLFYARSVFALAFGIATGVLLLAAARYLPRPVSDLALRVIGLTSMIYVPLDIFSDTIARSHLNSDARILAQEFGGPTVVWGAIWLGLSLATIGLCLRHGLGGNSNIARRRP